MAVNGESYNREQVDLRSAATERKGVWDAGGLIPGVLAPDFDLPRADAGNVCVRLSGLRGRPVLVHFASYTSPHSAGAVEPMRKLHAAWAGDVDFFDIFIRQAHPGPHTPLYHDGGEKMESARCYAVEEKIDYPVLVDDLDDAVYRRYGSQPDSSYIIDTEGRVAFHSVWTHAPTLHRALCALQDQGWTGVVRDGVDRTPHMLSSLADGWRGLQRTSLPGSSIGPMVGRYLKPMLAPIALRSEPIPAAGRLLMAVGAGMLCAAIIASLTRRRQPKSVQS